MTKHLTDSDKVGLPPAPIPPDPTGVPGLDELLGGGIQRGARFDRSLIIIRTELPTRLLARYPISVQPPEGLAVPHREAEQKDDVERAWDAEKEERLDDKR